MFSHNSINYRDKKKFKRTGKETMKKAKKPIWFYKIWPANSDILLGSDSNFTLNWLDIKIRNERDRVNLDTVD